MFGTIKTKLKEFGEKISDDAAKLGNLKLPIDPNDIVVSSDDSFSCSNRES